MPGDPSQANSGRPLACRATSAIRASLTASTRRAPNAISTHMARRFQACKGTTWSNAKRVAPRSSGTSSLLCCTLGRWRISGPMVRPSLSNCRRNRARYRGATEHVRDPVGGKAFRTGHSSVGQPSSLPTSAGVGATTIRSMGAAPSPFPRLGKRRGGQADPSTSARSAALVGSRSSSTERLNAAPTLAWSGACGRELRNRRSRAPSRDAYSPIPALDRPALCGPRGSSETRHPRRDELVGGVRDLQLLAGVTSSPSTASGVATTAFPAASASSTFTRIPPPVRSGAATTAARRDTDHVGDLTRHRDPVPGRAPPARAPVRARRSRGGPPGVRRAPAGTARSASQRAASDVRRVHEVPDEEDDGRRGRPPR